MEICALSRHAVGIVAGLALLAGCSSNGTTPSVSGSSVAPMSAHGGHDVQQHPLAHSWMQEPPKGTGGTIWATDLEYASVDVIAYPSGALIGQVSGFSYPYGDCSDKSGNVYVADFSDGKGFEIQAGTTKVINSWPTGGETIGCSVSDSGDVAFTNFYPGGVVVFPGGGPTGVSYPGPGYDWPAGYDPSGNLFVMCNYVSPCSSPHLAELPAGSSSWIFLNLSPPPDSPSGVQWMDKYLGVGANNGIELVAISGSNATVIKTIILNGGTCSTYMDFPSSWGSVSKRPDGVVTKKIKDLIAPNLWCFPTPINVYKAKGGDPISAIMVEPYQDDYGVTFTKP